MSFLKAFFQITKSTINDFIDDNGFQYSAAVSFYTLFSLAPIVLIAVTLGGIFAGNDNVLNQLTQFLNENIGPESADAVLLLIQNIQTETGNVFVLVVSIGFLIISATTVFVQLKDAFNRIFKVRPLDGVGVSKLLIDRLIAFGMIVLLGVALVFSMLLDSVLAGLSNLLLSNFESAQILMVGLGSNLLTLVLIFCAIWVMFTFLPDVKISKWPLLTGSVVTTLLLVIGKFGVGMIIGTSSLNELTGASSSVIILMLWVYYSCIIIFFGIELVKTLAETWEGEIKAGKYTRRLKLVEFLQTEKESKN